MSECHKVPGGASAVMHMIGSVFYILFKKTNPSHDFVAQGGKERGKASSKRHNRSAPNFSNYFPCS